MAGHCEALLIGKQQKMSSLMNFQQNQEYLMNLSLQNRNDDVRWMMSDFQADAGSHKVLPGFNLNHGYLCHINVYIYAYHASALAGILM